MMIPSNPHRPEIKKKKGSLEILEEEETEEEEEDDDEKKDKQKLEKKTVRLRLDVTGFFFKRERERERERLMNPIDTAKRTADKKWRRRRWRTGRETIFLSLMLLTFLAF